MRMTYPGLREYLQTPASVGQAHAGECVISNCPYDPVRYDIPHVARHTATTAYIALGSNLGDREENLRTAIDHISKLDSVEVTRVSSFLENAAIGSGDDAPPFLNAALEASTTVAAHPLLHQLLDIEKKMGRVRRTRWEPRVIDLDLVLYGNHIISSQELIVPHPLMHERRFVLAPLAEIAPEAVHPMLQMTMRGLLEDLGPSS